MYIREDCWLKNNISREGKNMAKKKIDGERLRGVVNMGRVAEESMDEAQERLDDIFAQVQRKMDENRAGK